MRMLRVLRTGLSVLLVVCFCAGFSFAGDKIQKKDQIRKKDGSCQNYIQKWDGRIDLAKDQIRKRDRKKDGSCQNYIQKWDGRIDLAKDQIRKRDRKKDGSCQS